MGMHKKKMMGRGGSAMYRMQKVYGGMPPKDKKRKCLDMVYLMVET